MQSLIDKKRAKEGLEKIKRNSKKSVAEAPAPLVELMQGVPKASAAQESRLAEKLFTAAQRGDVEGVRKALEEGAYVNAKDKNGDTALIWASENGHTDVVELLLKVPNIEVNATDRFGWTALIKASKNGHKEIVEALLNMSGIKVNIKDKKRKTALVWANKSGHKEVVKLLKEHGAKKGWLW